MTRNLFKNNITETNEHIFEVEGLKKGKYDVQAIQYDRIVSNSFYNKIMWGNTPKDYSDFCEKALKNNNKGIIADIGCGTLSFTCKIYAEHPDNNFFLCDLSYEMLKIGKTRIENICKNTSNFTFLRSDALNMPFKDNTIQTVLNFGLFHLFEKPSLLIKEITRILKPEGRLFLTSLCTDRKLSGKYLNLLHKKGHVVITLHSTEIRDIIEKNGIKIINSEVRGGMVYVSGIKTENNKQV